MSARHRCFYHADHCSRAHERAHNYDRRKGSGSDHSPQLMVMLMAYILSRRMATKGIIAAATILAGVVSATMFGMQTQMLQYAPAQTNGTTAVASVGSASNPIIVNPSQTTNKVLVHIQSCRNALASAMQYQS